MLVTDRWGYPWPSPREFMIDLNNEMTGAVKVLARTLRSFGAHTNINEVNVDGEPYTLDGTNDYLAREIVGWHGARNGLDGEQAVKSFTTYVYSVPLPFAYCPMMRGHHISATLITGLEDMSALPHQPLRGVRSTTPLGLCSGHRRIQCESCDGYTPTASLPIERYYHVDSFTCDQCGQRFLMNRTVTTKRPSAHKLREIRSQAYRIDRVGTVPVPTPILDQEMFMEEDDPR